MATRVALLCPRLSYSSSHLAASSTTARLVAAAAASASSSSASSRGPVRAAGVSTLAQRSRRIHTSSPRERLGELAAPTSSAAAASAWGDGASTVTAAAVTGSTATTTAATTSTAMPTTTTTTGIIPTATTTTTVTPPATDRVLGKLPLETLLRGIMIQEVMSRPYIMDVATNMLRSNMKLLMANPLFRLALDKLFYAQFCAGRTQSEIRQKIKGLRELGYRGAILSYAREVNLAAGSPSEEAATAESSFESLHKEHVAQWLEGTLKTIEYSEPGDLAAIKYTGAGDRCVHALETGAEPDATMADAMDQICQVAKNRGVKLLVDAEHYAQQHGIDAWTMRLMEKYNRDGDMVVYNTYQMYLKEASSTLAAHLQQAKAGGFGLGVKLVRGAYINSDPRHLIHDTKSDTDKAFDDAARMLATQHIDDPSAPKISLVLASHNKESMEMMRSLRNRQIRRGQPLADVVYAQLMGMADELSQSLTKNQPGIDDTAQVFKYVVWGTTEECMMYLLRRAEENRDAIDRSATSRQALWEELRGRLNINY